MEKVLILGGRGNLGNQIAQLIPGALVWDRSDLDVTNAAEVAAKFATIPDVNVVINCAAYNDLDAAEENPAPAFALNETAPRILAEVCKHYGMTLIQYSTGYVFSGEDGVISHYENAEPSPNSVYAQSKLAGERAIQAVGGKYYILRTNVLFGPMGPSESAKKSVVDVMKTIGSEKKKLRGITDEFSNFTYTPDLAKATVDLIDALPEYGVYHLVNEGYGSWYDLSKGIFEAMGWKVLDNDLPEGEMLPNQTIVIEKITGADYPRKAKRPTSAVLENTKLPKLRSWQDALAEYLKPSD
jgi:dTDP-4-dehydrorhamnose reductase